VRTKQLRGLLKTQTDGQKREATWMCSESLPPLLLRGTNRESYCSEGFQTVSARPSGKGTLWKEGKALGSKESELYFKMQLAPRSSWLYNSHQPSLTWARSVLFTICCSVASSNSILPSVTRSSDFSTTFLRAFLYFPSLLITSSCKWSPNEEHKSLRGSLHPRATCCLSRSIKRLLEQPQPMLFS